MKMKCTDIDEFVDDFLVKELSPLAIVAFEQHIAKCSDCKNKVLEAKAVQEELRNMAVPQPSPGFEQRVFANVRKHYKEESSWNISPGLAAGIASLSTVSLALWLFMGEQSNTSPDVDTRMVSIALNQTHPVRLMFDSDRDIKQAELSINLPENVELEGYPGYRQLKWTTNLKRGQNLLALPIKATKHGKGELHTQLSYNNSVQNHELLLNAASTSGIAQPDTINSPHKF